MLKQRFLIPFITIILIFITYSSLHSLAKLLPTGIEDYSLDTSGMNIRHHPPLFQLQKDNIFFVHPALEMNATGSFTFKKNENLLLHFSIQKGSSVGRILFVVKKNGALENKFLVDSKHEIRYRLKVNKDDTLTIIADPYGRNSGDWGNLQVQKYEPHYILKLRLVPFLWAIFFIYLIGKGHIYIALNSYIGFLLTLIAEKITFGPLSFNDTIGYTALFFFFAFLFTLIYQELNSLKKYKIATLISWIATTLLYLIPVSFIVFALVFGKPINWDILFAIYQTNPNEAVEYLESFIPLPYLFVALLFTLIIGYILWRQEMKERKTIERSLLILITVFLGSFLLASFLEMRIPHLIYDSLSKYNANIARLIDFQKKQRGAKIDFNATKEEKGETYVVVIGESLNKYNMSLYNYFRNTTPHLKEQQLKNDLQIFKNTYSCAGSTMQVLSLALTGANQYNGKQYYNSPSFIDIFNKAGFDTYWLARQGIADANVFSVIAHGAKHPIDLVNDFHTDTNSSIYGDERVYKPLKKALTHNKNTLIVIHLYGNHFHYQDRYPKQFEKYKTTQPYIIATNKSLKLNDYAAYDNSVLFNDHVINNILKIVQKHGKVSAFLYFSDHGEDIVRHHGHTSRINSFTYEMTQTPFIAWLSPEYKKRYPQTYKILKAHKESLFSNDMIYETLIGLAHIKTDNYKAKYDLTTSQYHLAPSSAYTLHRRRLYTSPDNYIYWRKTNTKLLQNKSFYKKIVINNTDSVGKLNDAWRLGFRSFKLNLYYMKGKESFQTGTDKYDTQGDLPDLLKYFPKEKIEHLLLHLANLSQSNLEAALKRLEKIEKKLPLKEKITLVLDKSNLIEPFKAKGWSVALKSNKVSESVADYSVIDAKEFKQVTESNNTTGKFIINHAFNLADSKLEKKLDSLQFNEAPQTIYILADFSSVYKW